MRITKCTIFFSKKSHKVYRKTGFHQILFLEPWTLFLFMRNFLKLKGPFIISTGGGPGHDFFIELKGGSLVFCSFIFKSGFLCLTMFLLKVGVSIKQFLTKMGYEIAYLMPTNYKMFLGKGRCPLTTPARPLNPCEQVRSQFKMEWRPWISVCKGGGAGLPLPPIFSWQSGEISHSGNLKLEDSDQYGIVSLPKNMPLVQGSSLWICKISGVGKNDIWNGRSS